MRKHKMYFMKDSLYRIVGSETAKQTPYNMLSPEEWLTVAHHVNAHKIGRDEGPLERTGNTEGYDLSDIAQTYYEENNKGRLLPKTEMELGQKVKNLVSILERDYFLVNLGKEEEVHWDLEKKMA